MAVGLQEVLMETENGTNQQIDRMEAVWGIVHQAGLAVNEFQPRTMQLYFKELWHLSFYVAALYLFTVYTTRPLIKRKFNTRACLALWNGLLAIFSLYGCVYVTWTLLQDLVTVGFIRTVCWGEYYMERRRLAYWLFLFCISKLPELFDTAFIVLRMAPLQILHTYHHASVLIFSWHVLAYGPAASYWYAAMNYLVHSIMYSYFCIRALNFKIPEMIAKTITSLQTLQMVVGLGVNIFSIYLKQTGHECDNTYTHSIVAISLYMSYFVLFVHFALNRYSKTKQQ